MEVIVQKYIYLSSEIGSAKSNDDTPQLTFLRAYIRAPRQGKRSAPAMQT